MRHGHQDTGIRARLLKIKRPESDRSTISKRILVTTSTFPRWENDVEPSFVYELCRRLKENYRIHVLAPHAPGALLEEQFDTIQVTRYRYFFNGWERLAYQGGILANLKQQPLRFGLVPFFGLFQMCAILKVAPPVSFRSDSCPLADSAGTMRNCCPPFGQPGPTASVHFAWWRPFRIER